MAARYWVGTGTKWDATTTSNWATTLDGTPGASVPTASDDVYFNSTTKFVSGIGANVYCRNLDVSPAYLNAAGSFDVSTTYPTPISFVNVSGNLSVNGNFGGPTLNSVSGRFYFTATTSGYSVSFYTVSSENASLFFDGVGGQWLLSHSTALGRSSLGLLSLANGTVKLNSDLQTFSVSAGDYNTGTANLDFNSKNIRALNFEIYPGTILTFSNHSTSTLTVGRVYNDLGIVAPGYTSKRFTYTSRIINNSTYNSIIWPSIVLDSSDIQSLDIYIGGQNVLYPMTVYGFNLSATSQNPVRIFGFNNSVLNINGGGTGYLSNAAVYKLKLNPAVACSATNCLLAECVNVTKGSGSQYGIVLSDTTQSSITIPADFDVSNNKIYLIGAGGGGSASKNDTGSGGTIRVGGAGGGGGGVTVINNFNVTPGSLVYYTLGLGGQGGSSSGASGANGGDTTFNSGSYVAAGGKGATTALTGSVGGAGGIGASFTGGAGGTGNIVSSGISGTLGAGGGGGGGAAGFGGNGGNGGNGNTSSTGIPFAGGGGAGGSSTTAGGAGGSATTTSPGFGGSSSIGVGGGTPGTSTNPLDYITGYYGGGGAGAYGTSTTQFYFGFGGNNALYNSLSSNTFGPGGGSSGINYVNANPGITGGLYGGGGGGGSQDQNPGYVGLGGNGAQGLIVITYGIATPSTSNTGNLFLFLSK